MPTAVLKADAVLDAVLDANCCPKSSQKMLDTKIMCCSVQQPYNHQPQRLIHQALSKCQPFLAYNCRWTSVHSQRYSQEYTITLYVSQYPECGSSEAKQWRV